MGNKQPQKEPPKLRRSEIEEFSKQSLLLPSVIEKLYLHFYRISSSRTSDGVIDISEFCLKVKRSARSLLIDRIFNMFDTNSDKAINFREFILGISIFSEDQNKMVKANSTMAAIRMKEKIDHSLRIIDMRGQKRVYEKDLRSILNCVIEDKAFLGISKSVVKEIVKRTIESQEFDEDENGKFLSQENYSKMVMKNPEIFKWLSVDLDLVDDGSRPSRNAAKCLSL